MKKLANYLLQGLLYIAPLSITGYIIYAAFTFLDGISQQLLVKFFDIKIPGLGLLALLVFLILVGIIGRTFIADPLKIVFKKIIESIPLLNFVYSAFNDLFSAFVGKEKKCEKNKKKSQTQCLGFLKACFFKFYLRATRDTIVWILNRTSNFLFHGNFILH